jgi:CheY-like chemotaxis protein
MGVSKSKNENGRSCPRIFIVDDEPILLELAQHVLSGLKCDIRTFTNPELALQAYSEAEKPPELVITDFAMHEMDGLALIRACRGLHPKQKILLVSGTVDESVFEGTGIKPDRFLAKPYQPAVLIGAVRDLLDD